MSRHAVRPLVRHAVRHGRPTMAGAGGRFPSLSARWKAMKMPIGPSGQLTRYQNRCATRGTIAR